MKRKHFLTHTITEDKKRYTIDYYPNQQRAMTTYSVNNTEQEKKIYCGREYEYNLTTNTQYNYIYVGDMPIALYVQGDTNAMYTLHTNYIGSIEKISDKNGNVVDSMSYTPFGQRRMFSDWSKTDTAKHLIDRGFTGQQHLDNFALINFNGRMYDPVLAHFLSPDPYIQNPENPLNHNRYAYCLFSPLQYVDPTGLMIWHPDKNGNLVAEEGDNITSLSKFLGISYKKAAKLLSQQGYSEDNLTEGDVVVLDNVFTRNLSRDANSNNLEELDYNCWGSAIAGVSGKEIQQGEGIEFPAEFDNLLKNDFISVDISEAKFGKTIIRFAKRYYYSHWTHIPYLQQGLVSNIPTEIGGSSHGAIYYGTSKDGTIYVYTKNGWEKPPQIMKLQDVIKKYGNIQGIGTDSGFYNKK